MKYKLISCDLDGSLLDNNAEVSQTNLSAIKELSDKGIIFVPNSGRTLYEIPAPILDLDCIRYIIYANGASIIDRKTGDIVSMCIDNETANFVLDTLAEFEAHITIRHKGKTYVDSFYQTNEDYEFYRVWHRHIDVIKKHGIRMSFLPEYGRELDDIEVFCVYFHSDEELSKCREILSSSPKLKLVESSEFNLEIFSSNGGKDKALIKLCEMLDVDISETISVGDSGNDIYMTKAAGLGLAVSNSCPEHLAVADDVICSNEKNAVKYLLDKYFN